MLNCSSSPISGVSCVIEMLILVPTVGIVLLAVVWCVYFLSRVRELGRKVHYLKKQTDERCCEELTNAKVDYVKSMFIAGISASEVAMCLCVFAAMYFHEFIRINPHDCPFPISYSKEVHAFRVFVLLGVSSIITLLSLSHTLTSYLSHAYAERRVIGLTRGDKVLLSCLIIQLVIIWITVVYWRAMVSVAPLVTLLTFPIHLWLYYKYSRRLHQLLKRRRLDAWYEFDPQPYKRLDGMCKQHKRGSILYVTCIVVLFACLLYALATSVIEMAVRVPCVEMVFPQVNASFLHNITTKYPRLLTVSKEVLYRLMTTLMGLLGTWSLLIVHMFILRRIVRKGLRRRWVHKVDTRGGADVREPLI